MPNAVATGMREDSTTVLLVVLFEPSPLPVADALPPAPPLAVLLFVLDEFPELVSVEFPLFFTADDTPVTVADPPEAVLVEFPPVAFDEELEFVEEVTIGLEVEDELLDVVWDCVWF